MMIKVMVMIVMIIMTMIIIATRPCPLEGSLKIQSQISLLKSYY